MIKSDISDKVGALISKGVEILDPGSVYIDDTVDLDRIDARCVLYPNCSVFGASTSIGPSCELGSGGPAVVRDCQLESGVNLQSGVFEWATFLDGACCGPGAQVRPGTVMEEHSSIAHSVGLKQTILMPYVTLGSLVNFCDCLMAGGTGKDNHSEVGSGFVHFNFTPRQEKATASLIGDVPRGVMLDQAPIFLGGQGGLVGPAVIEYGTVTAAGSICRKDVLDQGMLVYGDTRQRSGAAEFRPGCVSGLGRLIRNNTRYIGNLIALDEWYELARKSHARLRGKSGLCYDAVRKRIQAILDERCMSLLQLGALLRDAPRDSELVEGCVFAVKGLIDTGLVRGNMSLRERFVADWERQDHSRPYVDVIRSLPVEAKDNASAWLESIVDAVLAKLPLSCCQDE